MKIPYISALIRKRDAVETAQELASTLFMKGATLNLGAVNLSTLSKPPELLVDMPRYPWNHQSRYWHESRMTKKHKNRTIARNDILGTVAKYSNDMEPIWKNILRIDDLPWLQHHKIQSLTLFPISGFVAMALEAASQRATVRNFQYDNFELRNVTISTPLMIGDDGVETTLQLRPHQEGSLASSVVWDEFRIHSWGASKGWTEHCRGLIATKRKDDGNVVGDRLSRETEAALHSTITNILSGATVPIDKTKLYDDLSELGVSYGSSFQGMNNCQAGAGISTANVTVVDTAQHMPQGYQTSMIIHPVLLEQIVEMYWPILGAGQISMNTIYLPSSIGRMTVSREISCLAQTSGNSLRVFCKGDPKPLHPKPMHVSIFATAADNSTEALVTVDDLTVSPILEHEMGSESEAYRELCYKLDWEPVLKPLDLLPTNGVSNGISKHSNGCVNGAFHNPNGHQKKTSNALSNATSHHFNGHQNGTSSGLLNETSHHSNGQLNGTSNGLSNGTSNAVSNGASYGVSNGISNDVSKGPSNSVSNGTLNRVSNGTPQNSNGDKNETSNDVSNGVSIQLNGEHIFPEGLMTIIHADSEFQKFLASRLADDLEFSTGRRPDIGTLAEMETENRICLFLFELDRPLLSTLTLAEFTALQKLLTGVQGILWVVRGAYVGSQNPDVNMVTGLSRSIRSETLLKFATLDLDSKCILSIEDTVRAIIEVFGATFGIKVERNCELEYMERNGAFFTPRIINDDMMNEYVHKQTTASVLEPTTFLENGRPLKMAVGMPGAFETLHFVDQKMEEPIPEDEIEIEVKAIGMNSRDVAVAMGQLDTYDFGLECSGIVTKIGSNATRIAVGDHVAGISVSGGVYSTYARTKAAFAFRINDKMSFMDAASIPVAYCTAHYGLLDLAQIQNGERVLIHGAASAAGQAAIGLAQMIGAKIFATVSSVESKNVLMNKYGVCDDHIFSSHNVSFGPVLRHATGQGCFDVVLNCVPTDTDTLQDILDCLSNFGRFVDLGKQEGSSRLETSRFQNNRSFMSVDLISMAVERPNLVRRLLSNVCELLSHSKIRPVASITTFPISDIEGAFKLLHSGKNDGKLVVSPQPKDKVKVRAISPLSIFT